MSEENIVEYCAPTLAGIKTANLFSCAYHDKSEVMEDVKRVNNVLVKKGIIAIPIRYSNHRVLMYVFRPSFLEKDLCDEDTVKILSELGYEMGSVNSCVIKLRKRLADVTCGDDFPHEIGLFLGYPPEDVRGFIKHKGECSKCVGCWKVYGDVKKAVDTFDRYTKCTEEFKKRFSAGVELERLAVAI